MSDTPCFRGGGFYGGIHGPSKSSETRCSQKGFCKEEAAKRTCHCRIRVASVLETSGHANAESFKKHFHPHSVVVWGLLLRVLNRESEMNELSFINSR